MYELWLTANVLFELARTHAVLLISFAVLWIALVFAYLKWRSTEARPRIGTLLLVWIIATVVATLALPALTRSALANVAYLVDWLNLLAMAAGVGVVAAAFAWPLIGLVKAKPPVRSQDRGAHHSTGRTRAA